MSVPSFLLFGLLVSFTCWLSPKAHAHPHAWIDLRVQVLFNQEKQIVGLRQAWQLDPMYSLMVLEDMQAHASEQASLDAQLDTFGAQMIQNLAAYQYFSVIYVQGQRINTRPVQDFSIRHVNGRVELMFELLLDQASDFSSGLEYRIYDPTYYIEMLHTEEAPALSLQNPPIDCQTNIISANPTQEEIDRAAALDRTQEAPDNLGVIFAETAVIRCPTTNN
ncbi:ABC-type uncharacterized transport system, substrate-binding protein [Allopseudospirillum japonicum]|uniref:ABC-type uncharacterized transport system, substrate-binding protein n=1 Tax=Allopseudospirillum japonicum TaxID=64971 RepID=A0A1H6SRT7_9GAMM|nr:DUF1007 family protein [Allopseudospirillum japonicum]SEI66635.1 ABC-type uncharacterized transport system, substrate-binding protein [Allopseudospirillum japonicum]